jgi:hypothetical protein
MDVPYMWWVTEGDNSTSRDPYYAEMCMAVIQCTGWRLHCSELDIR